MDRAHVIDLPRLIERLLEGGARVDVAGVEVGAGAAFLRDRVRYLVAVRPGDRRAGLDRHALRDELDVLHVHGLAATGRLRRAAAAGICLLGRRRTRAPPAVVIVVVAAGGERQSESKTGDEKNEQLFHGSQTSGPRAAQAGPSGRA